MGGPSSRRIDRTVARARAGLGRGTGSDFERPRVDLGQRQGLPGKSNLDCAAPVNLFAKHPQGARHLAPRRPRQEREVTPARMESDTLEAG